MRLGWRRAKTADPPPGRYLRDHMEVTIAGPMTEREVERLFAVAYALEPDGIDYHLSAKKVDWMEA